MGKKILEKLTILNLLPFLLSLAVLLMLPTFSCTPKDIYEGVYKAQGETSQKCSNSQIELMEKGKAAWRIPDNEVSFRWNVKGDEIWLSTKSGGIIIGKIQGDIIEVKLPGAKTACSFKKESR